MTNDARQEGGALRLLGRSSSINVRKVLWTCAELSLSVEREDWGTGFRSTQAPEFLALNPNGLVPVLIDGDVVLWESHAICRYLARREGRTDLLPSTPREAARVEQWMDWQATELNSAWRYVFMARVRRDPSFDDARAAEASAARWNTLMTLLDRQLQATGAHVAGDGFSLADIVLALSAHRWRSTPMDARPALPAVETWLQRLQSRPGFQATCSAEHP